MNQALLESEPTTAIQTRAKRRPSIYYVSKRTGWVGLENGKLTAALLPFSTVGGSE